MTSVNSDRLSRLSNKSEFSVQNYQKLKADHRELVKKMNFLEDENLALQQELEELNEQLNNVDNDSAPSAKPSNDLLIEYYNLKDRNLALKEELDLALKTLNRQAEQGDYSQLCFELETKLQNSVDQNKILKNELDSTQNFNRSIEFELQQIKKQLDSSVINNKEQEQLINELKAKIESTANTPISELRKELETDKGKIENLNKDVESSKLKISLQNSELKNLRKSLEKKEKEVNELRAQNDSNISQMRSLNTQQINPEKEKLIKELTEQTVFFKARFSEANDRLKNNNKTIETLQNQVQAKDSELKLNQTKLSQNKNDLLKKLDEEKNKVKDYITNYEASNKQTEILKLEIADLKQQIETSTITQASLKDQINEKSKQQSNSDTRISQLTEEITKLNKETSEKENKFWELKRISDNNKTNFEENQTKLKTAEVTIQNLGQELNEKLVKVNSLQEDIQGLEESLKNTCNNLRLSNENFEEQKFQIKKLENLNKSLDEQNVVLSKLLEENQQQHTNLHENLNTKEATIRDLAFQFKTQTLELNARNASITRNSAELSKLEETNKNLMLELHTSTQTINQLEQDLLIAKHNNEENINNYKKEIENTNKEKFELKETILNYEENWRNFEIDFRDKENELLDILKNSCISNQLDDHLDFFEKVRTIVEILESEMEDNKLLEIKRSQLEETNLQTNNKYEKMFNELEEAYKKLEKVQKDYKQLFNEKESNIISLNEMDFEINKLNEQTKHLQKELDQQIQINTQFNSSLQNSSDIEKLTFELNNITQKLFEVEEISKQKNFQIYSRFRSSIPIESDTPFEQAIELIVQKLENEISENSKLKNSVENMEVKNQNVMATLERLKAEYTQSSSKNKELQKEYEELQVFKASLLEQNSTNPNSETDELNYTDLKTKLLCTETNLKDITKKLSDTTSENERLKNLLDSREMITSSSGYTTLDSCLFSPSDCNYTSTTSNTSEDDIEIIEFPHTPKSYYYFPYNGFF